MNREQLASYIRSQVEEMEETYNSCPDGIQKLYLGAYIEAYLDIYNKMFSTELNSSDYAWAKEKLANYDTSAE